MRAEKAKTEADAKAKAAPSQESSSSSGSAPSIAIATAPSVAPTAQLDNKDEKGEDDVVEVGTKPLMPAKAGAKRDFLCSECQECEEFVAV